MNVLPACMPACVHGTQTDQEKAWEPLEPELQKAVSCHVGAGYSNWSNSQFSYP